MRRNCWRCESKVGSVLLVMCTNDGPKSPNESFGRWRWISCESTITSHSLFLFLCSFVSYLFSFTCLIFVLFTLHSFHFSFVYWNVGLVVVVVVREIDLDYVGTSCWVVSRFGSRSRSSNKLADHRIVMQCTRAMRFLLVFFCVMGVVSVAVWDSMRLSRKARARAAHTTNAILVMLIQSFSCIRKTDFRLMRRNTPMIIWENPFDFVWQTGFPLDDSFTRFVSVLAPFTSNILSEHAHEWENVCYACVCCVYIRLIFLHATNYGKFCLEKIEKTD